MSLWTRTLHRTMKKFRLARVQRIRREFGNIDDMKVLDVGGSTHFWSAIS